MTIMTLFVVVLNLAIALRLVTFERQGRAYRRHYACLASVMIAVSLAHAVDIMFLGYEPSLYEFVLSLLLAISVFSAGGNVAKLWHYEENKV